eukprot:CAMPEP_0174706124 /NCGR_PEP_ID=MMETSP1094-20130205/9089_1 /TAXON_ID=156173 /ORGANISM="Chrysochromulina brevifilum, Strain UTEX LB 985" /LENGTH=238 /DNA_ID=CAMNT_0015904353 /DNA_START=18 /DNA_END=734 /DNA_ORIENTATION=+
MGPIIVQVEPPPSPRAAGSSSSEPQPTYSEAANAAAAWLRESLRMDDAESLEVALPEGVIPGGELTLTLPSNETITVPIPQDASPGDKLPVMIPRDSVDSMTVSVAKTRNHFPTSVKGKKLYRPVVWKRNMDSKQTYYDVRIPKEWDPARHTHLDVHLGHLLASICVPKGCCASSLISIVAPSNHSTTAHEIIIPEDAVPGSEFVANLEGELQLVKCPSHMKPGQKIKVYVSAGGGFG